MRIIRKRRRRNPKLSFSTIAKIERRTLAIQKLLATPSTYLRDARVKRLRGEINLLIREDEDLHDARLKQAQDKARANLAKPKPQDRRLKAYRDALKRALDGDQQAQALAAVVPDVVATALVEQTTHVVEPRDAEEMLAALHASIRAEAEALGIDAAADAR